MQVSKSEFRTFQKCPKAYYFEYIQKVPVPPEPWFEHGRAVHRFVKHFYERVTITDFKIWIQIPEELSPDEVKLVNNFVELEQKRLESLREYPEWPVYFYPILQEIKIIHPTKKMKGIPDWLFLLPNLKLAIGEIKTGKSTMFNMRKLRLEVCFYKELLEGSYELQEVLDALGIETKTIDFLFVEFPSDSTVHFEKFKTVSLKSFRKRFDETVHKIEEQKFPCNVAFHCRFCAYQTICPQSMEDNHVTLRT